jgi:prepilin-type N-terminal cleavage/methylation domain-containing protein
VQLITRLRARLAAEAGFTLVEMLTAMVIGTVVLFAAFTFMERSFDASAEISDRVDAAQRGRTAMDATIRQLRSQVCVAAKLPLQSASATSVTFTTDLTDGSQPLKTERRTLTFAPATKGYALTEQDLAMTAGPPTSPTVTWATSPKRSVTLISGVAQDGSTPFLQYFGWDNSTTPAQFKELTSPVAAADLSDVTQIRVTFAVSPEHGLSPGSRGATLTDQITLPQADPNQGDPTKTSVSPTC